jgi:hypothetical protein
LVGRRKLGKTLKIENNLSVNKNDKNETKNKELVKIYFSGSDKFCPENFDNCPSPLRKTVIKESNHKA